MKLYPVHEVFAELNEALHHNNIVILSAPPGSGKTTQVPLQLLKSRVIEGRIIMLQPRRVAARSVATWMAKLLDERVGEQVGYQVRHERHISQSTQIEVLTEGLLIQRLLSDPELSGVDLVILDEFHERNLLTDLTLMMLREAQWLGRDDLRLLVMSATLDAEYLAETLDAPLVIASGRSYPLEITYIKQSYTARELPKVIAERLYSFWFASLTNNQEETQSPRDQTKATPTGHCLIFLPGRREIEYTFNAIKEYYPQVVVSTLYGSLPLDAQRKALSPKGPPRIILSTNIAETSLTIDGVTHVIDSGLYRTVRCDPKTGLTRLITLPIAHDSATQRAGRAGRTQAGNCLRLWTEYDHQKREPTTPAEVNFADLTESLIKICSWAGDWTSFEWFDPPPVQALHRASEELKELGILHVDHTLLTPLGQVLAKLPIHPRRGLALLWGQRLDCLHEVAFMCALTELPRDPLAQEDLGIYALDPWQRWNTYQEQRDSTSSRIPHLSKAFGRDFKLTIKQLIRYTQNAQLFSERLKFTLDHSLIQSISASSLRDRVAFAFAQSSPRSIARRRSRSQEQRELIYHLSGGGESQIPSVSLPDEPSLIVALRSRLSPKGHVLIELAFPIDPLWLSPLLSREVYFDEEKSGVYERQRGKLGELTLWEKVRPAPRDSLEAQLIFKQVLTRDPWQWIKLDDEAHEWLQRLHWLSEQESICQVLSKQSGEGCPYWSLSKNTSAPNMSPLSQLIDYLANEVTHLKQLTLPPRFLPLIKGLTPSAWVEAVETLTPREYTLPTGQKSKVNYELGRPPSINVYLQALFGERTHPILGEPLLSTSIHLQLHLLAPNRRVTQITSDLPTFWTHSYPEVRRQLRGRYPKHHWPEDPLSIGPQRGVKKKTKKGD